MKNWKVYLMMGLVKRMTSQEAEQFQAMISAQNEQLLREIECDFDEVKAKVEAHCRRP